MNWFDEQLFGELIHSGYTQRFEITRVIHRATTDFQELLIFETPRFGRVLILDGIVQTTEADEFAYHEMMVHVPIFAHGGVGRVLIIGGGDGGCLREVLRHNSVERVTMVEIDLGVIESCRAHLPSLSAGAFDDPRLDLRIGDGCAHIRDTEEKYDLIVVDSTDPIGPGEALFTQAFFSDCQKSLTSAGVVVNQTGVPFMQARELTATVSRLRQVFADAAVYLVTVPTYVGGHMALAWGCEDPAVRQTGSAQLGERFSGSGLETRYYTPAVHEAAFALPPFISAAIGC